MRWSHLSIPLVAALLALPACDGPTTADRDNRRVLEEILTALTLNNARLLEQSAEHARQRHATGELAAADFEAMQAIVDKARGGDWGGAQSAAYAFRKQRPFVAR